MMMIMTESTLNRQAEKFVEGRKMEGKQERWVRVVTLSVCPGPNYFLKFNTVFISGHGGDSWCTGEN